MLAWTGHDGCHYGLAGEHLWRRRSALLTIVVTSRPFHARSWKAVTTAWILLRPTCTCVGLGLCSMLESSSQVGLCFMVESSSEVGLCFMLESSSQVGLCLMLKSSSQMGLCLMPKTAVRWVCVHLCWD